MNTPLVSSGRRITIRFFLSIRCSVVEQESPFLRALCLIQSEAIKGRKDERRVGGEQRNVAEKEIRQEEERNRRVKGGGVKTRKGKRDVKLFPRFLSYKLKSFRDKRQTNFPWNYLNRPESLLNVET